MRTKVLSFVTAAVGFVHSIFAIRYLSSKIAVTACITLDFELMHLHKIIMQGAIASVSNEFKRLWPHQKAIINTVASVSNQTMASVSNSNTSICLKRKRIGGLCVERNQTIASASNEIKMHLFSSHQTTKWSWSPRVIQRTLLLRQRRIQLVDCYCASWIFSGKQNKLCCVQKDSNRSCLVAESNSQTDRSWGRQKQKGTNSRRLHTLDQVSSARINNEQMQDKPPAMHCHWPVSPARIINEQMEDQPPAMHCH